MVSLKVMPLGDSITQGAGSGDGGGYRSPLYSLITGVGKDVNFVGSLSAGAFDQPEHEGHGGWTLLMLSAQIASWLASTPPDLVLLSAGTNDIINVTDVRAQELAERLGALLDDIHDVSASIRVLVAPVPPLTYSQAARARAAQFNPAARRQVEARADLGYLVEWAPMQWQQSDMGVDGIHPNDTGYLNFARAWHRPLYARLT